MIDDPVAHRQFSRRTRCKALMLLIYVLATPIIVGSWSVIPTVFADTENEAITETMAHSIARQVQTHLDQLKQTLTAIAEDEQTIAIFQQGVDDEALQAAAAEKQSLFDHALQLRYLKPNATTLNDQIPALSYASLEMLKKARLTSQINPEAHLLGTVNQHIVLVEQVVNSRPALIGLLHLSMDLRLFDSMLGGLAMDHGYVELTERVADQTLVLAKMGDVEHRQGHAATAGVADTAWTITYWPGVADRSVANRSTASGLPIIPIICLLLLIGVAYFIAMKKTRESTAAKAALITYEGAVRAIAEGAHAGIEHITSHLPKASRATAHLKPLSQALFSNTQMSASLRETDIDQDQSDILDISTGSEETTKRPAPLEIAPVIFRAYDIRGIVGESLTDTAVYEIARALGTMAHERDQQSMVVARDGRDSSPALCDALIKGLRSTGRDVIDIGMVPTPVLYFATHHLKTGSGVMVTGSHNAATYNGLKMMLAGSTLSGDDIQEIKQRTTSRTHATGVGGLRHVDIAADYIQRITEDIAPAAGAALKIVVDCGNGVAGILAPQLLNAIGHDVVAMYCDIDGGFPNHHPDPSQPENLQDLIDKVKAEDADIGFAFDGDGDRLGIVDAVGNIIWPDRQLMLLAKDVLSRNPDATIIFDVKCSRHLKSIIESNGGKPLMSKTGHSLIKSKMKAFDAPLAGEMSGHLFFKERWYGFDDALYAAARFIEIFTNAGKTPTALFAALPGGVATPELRIPLSEDQHVGFMEELADRITRLDAEIIDIDGLRIEFDDGWGLARPSNTSPNIILRFEGENEAALERIKSEFRTAIQSIISVDLPF